MEVCGWGPQFAAMTPGMPDGNLGVPPGLLHQRRGAEVGFRPMQHFLPEKLYPVAANVKPVFL